MNIDDEVADHTSGEQDHKQATLEYIVDMLGELASLALGVGEPAMAEGLRGIAEAHSVPSGDQRGVAAPH